MRAKRAYKGELSLFCLQTDPSFGKSQLLNAPKLANQNKNKMARNSKVKNSNDENSNFFFVLLQL